VQYQLVPMSPRLPLGKVVLPHPADVLYYLAHNILCPAMTFLWCAVLRCRPPRQAALVSCLAAHLTLVQDMLTRLKRWTLD
jgi:hypothetical protein